MTRLKYSSTYAEHSISLIQQTWLQHRDMLWNVSVSMQCKHYRKLQHIITFGGYLGTARYFESLNRKKNVDI